MTPAQESSKVDIFQNVHVADPEIAAQLYTKVFGLTPIVGLTVSFGTRWLERSLEFIGGEITVRFVKKGAGAEVFPAEDFLQFVDEDFEALLVRASLGGFQIIGDVEVIDEALKIVRMLDSEGNRIIVSNKNTWRRLPPTSNR